MKNLQKDNFVFFNNENKLKRIIKKIYLSCCIHYTVITIGCKEKCCIQKGCEYMSLREKIKERSKSKGVPLWRVAQEYGMSDSNFSRMLRYDNKVSTETEKRIYEIIDKLSAE